VAAVIGRSAEVLGDRGSVTATRGRGRPVSADSGAKRRTASSGRLPWSHECIGQALRGAHLGGNEEFLKGTSSMWSPGISLVAPVGENPWPGRTADHLAL
jgi:hypothetical protein